ncbi:MAG: lysophospholipid acyltransferase family protein [Chloroflexota bacterium]
MLKYLAFRLATIVLPFLPAKVGYKMAVFLADVAYLLAPGPRQAVSDNIRHVLGPDAEKGILRRTVRSVFRNTAKNYFDLFRLPQMNMGRIKQNLTILGWEYFERLRGDGKGVIIATAHLGSVDLVVQVLAAHSIGITVLAEPLKPPILFRLVRGLRESLGLSFLPVGFSTMKAAIRSLKQGGVVAVACDRDVLGKSIRTSFFGEETALPTGAIDLALKTGAAILPAFSTRLPDGRFEIRAEPPIVLGAVHKDDDVGQATAKIVSLLEKHIRRNPGQWVVFERVWDTN